MASTARTGPLSAAARCVSTLTLVSSRPPPAGAGVRRLRGVPLSPSAGPWAADPRPRVHGPPTPGRGGGVAQQRVDAAGDRRRRQAGVTEDRGRAARVEVRAD